MVRRLIPLVCQRIVVAASNKEDHRNADYTRIARHRSGAADDHLVALGTVSKVLVKKFHSDNC